MYQALYRKWRPKTFDDVVGQAHITETLKNQISTGRLSHAYLFIGTRGTGKTTCAKILAKAVNCEQPVDGNPCGECKSCIGIESGGVMDVVELDAASNNGVDNVRALRDEAVFSPAQVKKRVYIVDEVHMLSTSAFNALLKILEEPPAHLMFILATTELNKVPATILSRCQRHSFKRIDGTVVAKRLGYVAEQENLDLSPDAAALLARLAEGSMRDALSLLDQCSGGEVIDSAAVLSAMGLAGRHRTAELLKTVTRGDTEAALSQFSQLWSDGKDPATLLDELSALMRDVLMLKVAPKGGKALISGGTDPNAVKELGAGVTEAALISGIDAIQSALGTMRTSPSPRTVAELCLIGLCEPALGESLSVLRTRVAKLENAIEQGIPMRPAGTEPVREDMDEGYAQGAPAHNDTPEDIPFAISGGTEPVSLPEEPEDEAVPFDLPEDEGVPFDFTEEAEEVPIGLPEEEADEPPGAPVPEPSKEAAVAREDGFWERLLDKMTGRLPVGIYNLLTDPVQVSGALEGDTLTVKITPGFAMNMLNKPDVIKQLGAAVLELTGRETRVTMEAASGKDTAPARSVDELGKFGIVTFK